MRTQRCEVPPRASRRPRDGDTTDEAIQFPHPIPHTIEGMAFSFEVHTTAQSGGRRGRLTLPHGVVETPVFMPVGTAASVKAVEQSVLEQIGVGGNGAQIVLANTYHLYLRPGHELVRRMGGVHRFMSWQRPLLTDSGGFQV